VLFAVNVKSLRWE